MDVPSEAGRELRLDGIRGIAVLLVLLYHLEPPRRLLPFDVHILPGGWIGVQLFFVLSGYLITRLLLVERRTTGTIDRRRFYLRRVRRLLPALTLLLVAWLVATASGLVPVERLGAPPTKAGPSLALAPVLGVASLGYNWLLAFAVPAPVGMIHLWTLSVEEQFYLLLPTVILVVVGRSRRPEHDLARLVGAAIAISLLLTVAATVNGHRDFAYFSTATSGIGILLGARLALRPPARRIPGLGIGGLAALAALALTVSDYRRDLVPLAQVLSAFAAVAVVGHGGRVLDRFLEARWLRWSGRRSYALYLWSSPVAYAVGEWGGTSWLMDAAVVGASFGLAELSWRLVERRFLARRERSPVQPRLPLAPVAAER